MAFLLYWFMYAQPVKELKFGEETKTLIGITFHKFGRMNIVHFNTNKEVVAIYCHPLDVHHAERHILKNFDEFIAEYDAVMHGGIEYIEIDSC